VRLLLAAAAVFLAAAAYLHVAPYVVDLGGDIRIYEGYGDSFLDGRVPYRDVALEYPPGAIPAFVVPAVRHEGQFYPYRRRFEALMIACGLVAIGLTHASLRRLSATPRHVLRVLGLVAVTPLLLGGAVFSHFDLLPAAITAAAVWALASGRVRLGSATLGLGTAVKAYPALVLPLALVHVARRRGAREAALCACAFSAVVALAIVPFLVLAPGGLWSSVSGQASRPLQIESLGAAVLLAGHHLFGLGLTSASGHGSQNLVGSLPDAVATAQSAALAAVVLVLWIGFARGPADRHHLIRSSAATVAAAVAFGKVLSPQFLVWLVPLVPLVRGRRGLAASALLGVALLLTQLWTPSRYWALALDLDATASWLVLVRDLVLVALLALLALPARGPSTA
jgi:hypothetical protein